MDDSKLSNILQSLGDASAQTPSSNSQQPQVANTQPQSTQPTPPVTPHLASQPQVAQQTPPVPTPVQTAQPQAPQASTPVTTAPPSTPQPPQVSVPPQPTATAQVSHSTAPATVVSAPQPTVQQQQQVSQLFPEKTYSILYDPKGFKDAFQVHTEAGSIVAFAESKTLTLKTEMHVYADNTKTREIMTIKAQNAIGTTIKNDVVTTSGQKLGEVHFKAAASFLTGHFEVADSNGAVVASIVQKLMWGLVDKIISGVFAQTFVIKTKDGQTGEVKSEFNTGNIKMKLTIPDAAVDHAVWLAAALLITAQLAFRKAMNK